MAFWHEFPFDLCYFAAPPFFDARCRLLRRLVAFILPKSHQILKIYLKIFFLYIFIFYLGCFFLSVIIWIGSWTKTRCEYAVSFDLAGTFGHTLLMISTKWTLKKLKIFVVEWLKRFTGKFFDLLIAGVPKLPHNFHQKINVEQFFCLYFSFA